MLLRSRVHMPAPSLLKSAATAAAAQQSFFARAMTDSAKYFGTQKRGEIFELKEELLVSDIAKKRDAVKKVIAAMTVGKDVTCLFTDVLYCMMTSNVEIKKLVYLYIMN